MLLSLCYKRGNGNKERLSSLPRLQLLSGGAEIQIEAAWFQKAYLLL